MSSTEPHTAHAPYADVLRAQPLLSGLPEAVRDLVADSFVPASFAFGEEIVVQGDPPDGFYVLAEGRARAVREKGGAEIPLGVFAAGESFGESGLLEQTPRQATVRASGPVTVLRLDPALFAAIVHRHPEVAQRLASQTRARRLEPLLRSHPIFSELPREALTLLAAEVDERSIGAGATIFREGDPPGPLYLLIDGRVRVRDRAHGDLRYLRAGDLFGEVSFYLGGPRTATVESVSDVRLAGLDAAVFARFEAEHPSLRVQVAERVAFYERGPARHVPVDFADELLPAAARSGAPDRSPEQATANEAPTAIGSRWRGPRLRRSKHVPHVTQLDEMDCGAACVAMACRAFGHAVPIAYIRDLVGTSVDGTSLDGIRRGGEAVGLEIRPLKVSKDRLDELALPAIVHWRGTHWMLLDEVRDDRVHVADPASTSRWIARAEFLEHWSGFSALVSATPALRDAPSETADLRWLAPFVRPHRRRLLLVAVLALVAALLQMLVPVVTGEIINSVVKQKDYTRLYELIGGLLLLQAVALVAALVEARLITRVAVRIDGESLDHIAGRLLNLPLSYFESRRTGDIERRLDGVRQVREFAAQRGVYALAAAGQLVAAVILMAVLSVPLMLVWLATLPIYLRLMRSGTSRVRPAYAAEEEGFARYRSRRLDAIRGVETVKSLGAEGGLRRRMVRDFEDVAERIVRADLAAISYGGAISFVTFVLLILFLFLGALEVMAGNLSIGALVAFNSLVLLSSGPVVSLLGLWDQWQLMAVILARIRDILDRDPEQTEGIEALRAVPTLEGRVTLANVGFRYPTAPDTPILEEITLDVAPGTTVAVVGRSGSGKSTLLKCLAGLLQVTEGSIAFDSIDLHELRWTDLRQRIGLVPQKPYLFDDSLERNIAFGEDDPDMDAVQAAAEIADARGFIERLPMAYDTRVGDGGLLLSGGQAQRVAIARSIFHRPPVLLLDEATSALDSEAERAVTENMRRLLEGRTAFIVAHRLSTVRDADVIVVLEQGRIAESGTHDELLARDGLYFYLYGQQVAGS